MTESKKKPIAYLDVDDTLIIWNQCNPITYGLAAPRATEFVLWLDMHFEIRWLTMWCPNGVMEPNRLLNLSTKLDIPVETLERFNNPMGFFYRLSGDFEKYTGIDWNEVNTGRRFIWVEDKLRPTDFRIMRSRRKSHCHIPCNVTINPDVIDIAWQTIRNQFNIED